MQMQDNKQYFIHFLESKNKALNLTFYPGTNKTQLASITPPFFILCEGMVTFPLFGSN